jgi:hypothetical protein
VGRCIAIRLEASGLRAGRLPSSTIVFTSKTSKSLKSPKNTVIVFQVSLFYRATLCYRRLPYSPQNFKITGAHRSFLLALTFLSLFLSDDPAESLDILLNPCPSQNASLHLLRHFFYPNIDRDHPEPSASVTVDVLKKLIGFSSNFKNRFSMLCSMELISHCMSPMLDAIKKWAFGSLHRIYRTHRLASDGIPSIPFVTSDDTHQPFAVTSSQSSGLF